MAEPMSPETARDLVERLTTRATQLEALVEQDIRTAKRSDESALAAKHSAQADYYANRADSYRRQSAGPAADAKLLRAALAALSSPPADEAGWVIERDIDSTLHYWTGRVIDYREDSPGQWSPDHRRALRLARRTDAESMLTWQCQGIGRIAEHRRWVASTTPAEREAVRVLEELRAVVEELNEEGVRLSECWLRFNQWLMLREAALRAEGSS